MSLFNVIAPSVGQILEHTPEGHADRNPLREALERAEELCSQVNEGVREKENSDRLEWLQGHVQCEGPIEVNTIRYDSSFMVYVLYINADLHILLLLYSYIRLGPLMDRLRRISQ